jgi:hypothetical protein
MTPLSSPRSLRSPVRPPLVDDRERSPRERLQSALQEASSEVEDALERLQMAQTDVEGDNQPLDAVEALLDDALADPDHLRSHRAKRIAASVADDLETVVARLRRAAE